MSEFKTHKLGDIAEILTSNVDKKITPNQKTVKLCNFVDVYHNWAITKDNYANFMTATASDDEISKFSLKKGQVAFTKDSETRDDIGIPTYIAESFDDVVLGYHTALATPDETIVTGEYLNAFMHSNYIQKYFEYNATGSGMRYTLSQQTLHDIPILAPDLSTQKKIGALLTNIDRKITINREINRNLEELAKQIYDYWFVQFDFPNEEGKPYKSSGGKMVWNETLKREIPADWEVKKLNACLKHINTGLNPRDNFVLGNGNIKYITVKNLTTDGTIDFSGCDLIDENARKIVHERSKISKGDILFASISPLGRCYIIQEQPEKWDINESVFSIRPNQKIITPEYLYCYLTSEWFMKKAEKEATGSIFAGIRMAALNAMTIIVPDEKVLKRFSSLIKPIFGQKDKLFNEIQHLTKLRDELLPLLMNGQVTLNSCLSQYFNFVFYMF